MSTIRSFGKRILAVMAERPTGLRKTASGLFVPDKDKDTSGVRPRWFKVHSVGEQIDWCSPGQYIMVEHGRWSNGVKADNDLTLWLIDNECCLMISDEVPEGIDQE
jgi:hypothetical protein